MNWHVKVAAQALMFAVFAFCCTASADLVEETNDIASTPPAPDPTPAPIPPVASGVLWQFGTSFMREWSGEGALINVLKENRPGKDWPADVFDRETQTFLKIPDGARELGAGGIRYGARFNPQHYAGDWIIDWEGEGEVFTNLGGGEGPEAREGPNRIRETYDGRRAKQAGVVIRKIGTGGIRNLRVYRAEHEAALKAGKVFNPAFVDLVSRYDIVRPLDWSSASVSRVTRAGDLPDFDTLYWGAGIVPYEAQFRLANEAGVALWLNLPPRIGAPAGLNEQLESMSGGARQKERTALIAANFDAVDASPEWDNFAAAVVAAMDAAGYPADRPFYLELSNETWNWGGAFSYATEWYWALTDALVEKTGHGYAGNPRRGAYGYFSAKMAEAFAVALDAAGRGGQPWTMVIGSQTAWDAHTTGALRGVADYEGGSRRQEMDRYGVAVTGYYSGLFHNRPSQQLFGRRMSNSDWRAEWLRRFNADRAGFAQWLYDQMAGGAAISNVDWIVRQSLGHKEVAESFGARFIGQYEGSSHDTLDSELAKNPEILQFYKDFWTGPHGAAIIRLHADRMSEALPGAILSNYQQWSFEGVKPDRPWIEGTPWGPPTEAEQALEEVLE